MSTILDALRKLEEEQQSRTADARSRLLLPSVYRARPTRTHQSRWQPRTLLFGVLGFALAGFAAGAAIVWQHTPPLPLNNVNVAKESASTLPPTPKKPQPTVETPQTPPASPATPLAQPETTVKAEKSFPDERREEHAIDAASAVQRSPFIAAPPAPREPVTAVRRAVAPPPSVPKGKDEASYKVLTPSGAVRPATPPAPAAAKVEESPASAPSGTSLSLLQWSRDPEKRIAFIRVNGGALTMAHEGDTVGGYKVVAIRQNAVELQSGESHVTLRAR